MKLKIHLHPVTVLFFAIIFFTPYKGVYLTYYTFIFLHELSHALACIFLRENNCKIHLLPWGCLLTFTGSPSKIKSILIFIAGPLFNIIMALFGVFPKENLLLALFNLFPVPPLDGGIIVSLIMPGASFYISLVWVGLLFLLCLYKRLFPLLPLLLLGVVLFSEKHKIDKNINSRVISHFFVEKKAEKLYNTIDKV